MKQEQMDDVPTELIHRIQLLLPLKEAARTSILCKSWLHAWHTIPILRFPQSLMLFNTQSETKFLKLINRIILRYLRNQTPIESFSLQTFVQNHETAYLAEKVIRRVAQKSYLKHLSVTVKVMNGSFTLPPETLFSGENLFKLSVVSTCCHNNSLCISSDNTPVFISCVSSLRELELIKVYISEDLLNNLLSACKLLETIKLFTPLGVQKIKVKNLHRLRQLQVTSHEQSYIMEIDDVPSLCSFTYDSYKHPLSINFDSLGTLKELFLGGGMVNNEYFDVIQSSLPFLESLSLKLGFEWKLRSLRITYVSLKRLTVSVRNDTLTHIHIFAPKLLYFCYNGCTAIPRISFPTVAPKQITLSIRFCYPIKYSFFVNMREILNLSSTFDIIIVDDCRFRLLFPLDFDVDDLNKKLPLPAKNVQHLSLSTCSEKRLWEDSQYFDVFFSVCRPTYVDAYQFTAFKDKKCFSKIMARMAIEKKLKQGFWSDLKDVEIKDPIRGHWETLADYWKFFPDVSAVGDWFHAQFKLSWSS